MEVHHHPHVEKKNFKEYFLEFLMIFLAVTMGFFAENLREQSGDAKKEKELINGLIENMSVDTSELNRVILRREKFLGKMDSCLAIPISALKNINVQDTFFHLFIYFYDFTPLFLRNDITISQLGSGGYSFISKKVIRDSISSLNQFYETLNLELQASIHEFYLVNDFAPTIMRIAKYPVEKDDPFFNEYLQNKEIFTKQDPASLEQLYGLIRVRRGDLEQLFNWFQKYRTQTIRLISYLQTEYHLDQKE